MKQYETPKFTLYSLCEEDVVVASPNVLNAYDDVGEWNAGWFGGGLQ